MIDPATAARVLNATAVCRRRGVTQSQIAEALGASQSQVSRILSGRSRRGSRLLEEVCLYIERLEGGVTSEAVAGNQELIDAICVTWDGSAAHAKSLAIVIRSLATLGPRRDTGPATDLPGS